MDTLKRISVDQLTPGMFVVKLDRPWLKTPFLFHKRMIKDPAEIALLKRHGVREVVIDLAKGEDYASAQLPDDGVPDSAEADGGTEDDKTVRMSLQLTPQDEHAGGADQGPLTRCTIRATGSPAAGSPHRAGCEDGRGSRQQDPHFPVRLPSASQAQAARKVYAEAHALIERVFDNADAGTGPPVASITNTVTDMLARILEDRSSMLMHLYLRQMRRYDQTLASHAVDVGALSLLFAVESGLSPEDREDVGAGALLHDLGYLRLPRNLFRKGSRCTEQERALLHRHPLLGEAIVADCKEWRDGVRRVIAEHHERRDGSGFPRGLAGSQLSPLSQLVGMADTYLSLIAPRDGQAPLIPSEAIKHLFLQGRNGKFDVELIEVAVKSLGVYPIGSLVELNTGQRGP